MNFNFYDQRYGDTMIYYTGDIHGSKYELTRFLLRNHLSRNDIIVVFGDVGANFFVDKRDVDFKKGMRRLRGV